MQGELLTLDRLEQEGRPQAGAADGLLAAREHGARCRHAGRLGNFHQTLLASHAARDIWVGRQWHVGYRRHCFPVVQHEGDVFVTLGEQHEALAGSLGDGAQGGQQGHVPGRLVGAVEAAPADQVADVRPNSVSCSVIPCTGTPCRPSPRVSARPACSRPKTTAGRRHSSICGLLCQPQDSGVNVVRYAGPHETRGGGVRRGVRLARRPHAVRLSGSAAL